MSEPAAQTDDPSQSDPYIVCRVEGAQMHCALWTLEGGDRAIALFLTRESAEKFFGGAGLDAPWRIERAYPKDLLTILRHSHLAGVRYAVLDPDESTAKQLFDLETVLAKIDADTANPQATGEAAG
jgi:hypothetical protein